MFAIAEAMNFNHLPLEGGLYDQHPALLDDWQVIFQIKGREQKRQQDKKMREAKRKGGGHP